MITTCDIATEQGHISITSEGDILLYADDLCYDIAHISKNTRDKLVECLLELKYIEEINDNIY